METTIYGGLKYPVKGGNVGRWEGGFIQGRVIVQVVKNLLTSIIHIIRSVTYMKTKYMSYYHVLFLIYYCILYLFLVDKGSLVV